MLNELTTNSCSMQESVASTSLSPSFPLPSSGSSKRWDSRATAVPVSRSYASASVLVATGFMQRTFCCSGKTRSSSRRGTEQRVCSRRRLRGGILVPRRMMDSAGTKAMPSVSRQVEFREEDAAPRKRTTVVKWFLWKYLRFLLRRRLRE